VDSEGRIPGLRYKVGLGLLQMSFEHKRDGDQHATANDGRQPAGTPMQFSLRHEAIEN